jgi:hypothetical protein
MTIDLIPKRNNAIIPLNNTLKRTKQVPITFASAQAGFTPVTEACVGIFYADSSGVWRLRFNAAASFTSATVTILTLSITNVTFGAISQSISASINASVSGNAQTATCAANSSTIYVEIASTTNCNGVRISGDVLLASEPTAYTTAANMEGLADVSVYVPPASATTFGTKKLNRVVYETFADGDTNPTGLYADQAIISTTVPATGNYIIRVGGQLYSDVLVGDVFQAGVYLKTHASNPYSSATLRAGPGVGGACSVAGYRYYGTINILWKGALNAGDNVYLGLGIPSGIGVTGWKGISLIAEQVDE